MTGTGQAGVERGHVIRGDARHLPLRDNSVDLIITSPPYLWKRKYAINGTGEMGNERDWRAFLDNLFLITDEMLRVLKMAGSIWVNLGDTRVAGTDPKWLGIPVKSKLLLPERYRIGCQDRYASWGVIIRQVQIWEKVNGLPESTTDRTRDSHEDWVHLVKSPRYYAALDEIREPYSPKTESWRRTKANWTEDRTRVGQEARTGKVLGRTTDPQGGLHHVGAEQMHPLGKLPGSVWSIPSEPLRLPPWIDTQHYAAFPTRWPEQLIKAFSPPGICTICKVGRFPIVHREPPGEQPRIPGRLGQRQGNGPPGNGLNVQPTTIVGYACGCTPHTDHPATGGRERNGQGYAEETGHDAHPHGGVGMLPRTGPWREYHLDRWKVPPTRPAVVLDPFGGTGTVIHVAKALGRIGVSIDLSEPYSRLATDQTLARQRAAKVLGRVHLERQGTLFAPVLEEG